MAYSQVEDTEARPPRTAGEIVTDEDGSGAIVLGCAGMADLARDLQGELGVPVIDGASRWLEACAGIDATP